MVAESGLAARPKIQSAFLVDWPAAIDINNDIVKRQFADTWLRKLNAALASRDLLDSLLQAPPSMADFAAANPLVSKQELQGPALAVTRKETKLETKKRMR